MRSFTRVLIPAVISVILLYLPASAQSYSGEISDAVIEQEVKRKILRLPYYEIFDHISFRVDNGTVTLFGKVLNGTNKGSAEAVAKRVRGVERVINKIEILPPGRFDDSIRRRLVRSIAGTANLYRYIIPVNPPVRLIVDRGHITLEGYVSNRTDANLIEIAARSVPGVFSVTNNLRIGSGRIA